MKVTDFLFAWHAPGKGRKPQPENKVPFQEILPMRLKNRVSGKFDKHKEGDCLYEMTLVISCLQQNEYENKLCQKEVKNFNECYNKYLNERFIGKRAQEQGLLIPGERNLTHKQIRKLLKFRPLL